MLGSMLSDTLSHAATHSIYTWGNASGTRVISSTRTVADVPSLAQPMKADRVIRHQLDAGEVGWTVYYDTDPGLKVDDVIIVNGHTILCLGPALDQGGQGECFAVDGKELV